MADQEGFQRIALDRAEWSARNRPKNGGFSGAVKKSVPFPLKGGGIRYFWVREDWKRLKTSVCWLSGLGRSSVLSVHSLKILFPTCRVRALIRRTRFSKRIRSKHALSKSRELDEILILICSPFIGIYIKSKTLFTRHGWPFHLQIPRVDFHTNVLIALERSIEKVMKRPFSFLLFIKHRLRRRCRCGAPWKS